MPRKKLPQSREILQALVAELHLVMEPPLTQDAIADKLGVNKTTVSRLLRDARRKGVFKVLLNLPHEQELQLRLVRQFGLIDAVVVPIITPHGRRQDFLAQRVLGEAAARYLESPVSPIRSGLRVGISCGGTISNVIAALTPQKFARMTISQLTIESECDVFLHMTPFTLVGMLYAKWNDETDTSESFAVQPLPGSMRIESNEWNGNYRKHRDTIMRMAERLDVAILGIGSCGLGEGSGTYVRILEKHGITREHLKEVGAIGEICNRPYDIHGQDLSDKIEGLPDFVDGVDLELLRNLVQDNRRVIAIAAGRSKFEAIRVALMNRLANYLVTDIETAQRLCE